MRRGRDAVPAVIVNLEIGFLEFAIESCFQEQRPVHQEHGEFVFDAGRLRDGRAMKRWSIPDIGF